MKLLLNQITEWWVKSGIGEREIKRHRRKRSEESKEKTTSKKEQAKREANLAPQEHERVLKLTY